LSAALKKVKDMPVAAKLASDVKASKAYLLLVTKYSSWNHCPQ